ncbi:MAG: O-methyltransferase [Bacteroidales bacterium]|nr:O-methyltransferase [Bacteroidales bacterium]
MDFLDKKIYDYSEQHTTLPSKTLVNLDRETHLKVLRPRMLSGHLQGKFLEMMVKMIRPKEILEIGTYTGYSAIAMAEGIEADACIHTIDINAELEDFVKSYFIKANVEHQIELHIGNALNIIPELDLTFDLVFIDADKINYKNYFDLVLPKVRKGGFIIADNVLWSGKVINTVSEKDSETAAIQHFNDYIQSCDKVNNLLLPLRDGLMIMEVL